VGASVAILLPLLAAGCVRTIRPQDLLRPRKSTVLSDTVERRNVEVLTPDVIRLRGWFLRVPGAKDSLICFGGAGETVLSAAWRWYLFAESYHVNVLVLDYRGYGFSDGAVDVARMLDDAVLGYDRLSTELLPDHGRVFAFGFSLGSPVALHLAALRRLDGLILQGTWGSLGDAKKAWRKRLPWYARCFVRLRLDASLRDYGELAPTMRDLAVPLLVVQGERDELFPVENARALFDASRAEMKLWCPVPAAGHDSLDLRADPAAGCLKDFFARFP
jgi:hypothetical protein